MPVLTENSIKAKNPARFTKTELFLKVMTILESHHFRLPVCRFVIDLFDKKVMRQVVLEEEDEEDSDDEDDDDDDDDSESDLDNRLPNGNATNAT